MTLKTPPPSDKNRIYRSLDDVIEFLSHWIENDEDYFIKVGTSSGFKEKDDKNDT